MPLSPCMYPWGSCGLVTHFLSRAVVVPPVMGRTRADSTLQSAGRDANVEVPRHECTCSVAAMLLLHDN